MIQTAVFGFGNIGGGVVDVIEGNQSEIVKRIPEGMAVKYVLDIRDFPDSPYRDRVVHDIDIILNDPEIRVVCETMGGKEPAFTFTKRALERGISVCSSNKELVEAHGAELLEIARKNHCSYLFEASVGGGIPLLRTLIESLSQERVTSILGILNGTTNFILSKMEAVGADYAQTLKEAQELGYAERNPTADVEGHDTGRKIAILSSLMTGKTVHYDDITVEGISAITSSDFDWAHRKGYTIKLLGRSARADSGLQVLTAPYLVPKTHPLAMVNDVFNGVFLHGNMVDDVMLYGRGAGKLPTGSAVVADMLEAAAHQGETVPVRWSNEVLTPLPKSQNADRYCVRVPSANRADAERALEGMVEEVWSNEDDHEFVCATKRIEAGELEARLNQLGDSVSRIRILA
ncbi:MAG: homoserine dehydrogenase [Clostridia bacterium]|nr:homoserine dehydrogenase [Clostridia bacterium]